MVNRVVRGLVVASIVFVMTACGRVAPASESLPQQSVSRWVYCVQPKSRATIKTMSTFLFRNDQVTIGAVPPGNVTADMVRPGITPYHLGVDADCLPAGVVIPKADPWIHFGDGKNEIEMQLPPGQHKLGLQSGDDMHRTIDGLSETINVTVVQ